MTGGDVPTSAPSPKPTNVDFWKYFTGQVISNLGGSFTLFALPLLVYQLTGSPINLGLTTTFEFLPYLLFGLIIGAYVDRFDRKRMMIVTDLLRAGAIAAIPLLYIGGVLDIWMVYAIGFVSETLRIFFEGGEFAVIPSLVGSEDLVTANGRIQAGYQGAQIAGPILAGAMLYIVPLEIVFFVDAASFAVSALSIAWIRSSLRATDEEKPVSSILDDIKEGLRYVWAHPVLRNISIMMALVNFFSSSAYAQLVVFAKQRLAASGSEIGFLFAASSAGVAFFGLIAGRLRKRWSFSLVALGALVADGIFLLAFSLQTIFWVALPLWGLSVGVGLMFNINTMSLRQQIVPSGMLGRVMSIASVLAWSAIPAGAALGGFVIEWTDNVALVYAGMGILTILIPLVFSLTALGHADDYVPKRGDEAPGAAPAS